MRGADSGPGRVLSGKCSAPALGSVPNCWNRARDAHVFCANLRGTQGLGGEVQPGLMGVRLGQEEVGVCWCVTAHRQWRRGGGGGAVC